MARSTHHSDYQLFQMLLREAREQAGMTQVELAEKLGNAQTFVSKFERGERRVDLIETVEICEAIGVEPEALLAEYLARRSRKMHSSGKKLSK